MKKSKVFWGIIFIAIAIFWILSGLGLIKGVQTSHIIFSGIWGAMAIVGIFSLDPWETFFGLAFLSIVWDRELGIENLTPWPVIGIAFLLSIGFTMIFSGKRSKWKKQLKKEEKKCNQEHVEGEHIYKVNKLSGTEEYIDSKNLKSIEVVNKAGGMEIYLDKAQAAGEVVFMKIECIAGGVEVYIPNNWKVESNVKCIAGSVELPSDNPRGEAINDVTLKISGQVKAGGVEVVRVG